MTLVGEPSPGAADFEFDIAGPLFMQIRDVFDRIEPVPLTVGNLGALARRAGVYGLTHDGALAYVGKADQDVRGRLSKHRRQLEGRIGIAPADVSFRCVYLATTWDPFKPETHLIEHYGTRHAPGWNWKGFGPNDPGRQRDHTVPGDDDWHVRFPLDPDHPAASIQAGDYTAIDLLRAVAAAAPYWVRFQGNRRGTTAAEVEAYETAHAAYAGSVVRVPRAGMSIADLVVLVAKALPEPGRWQATQLPSRILLYRERDAQYPRMRRLWP